MGSNNCTGYIGASVSGHKHGLPRAPPDSLICKLLADEFLYYRCSYRTFKYTGVQCHFPCAQPVLHLLGPVVLHPPAFRHPRKILQHTAYIVQYTAAIAQHTADAAKCTGNIAQHMADIMLHTADVTQHTAEIVQRTAAVAPRMADAAQRTADNVPRTADVAPCTVAVAGCTRQATRTLNKTLRDTTLCWQL